MNECLDVVPAVSMAVRRGERASGSKAAVCPTFTCCLAKLSSPSATIPNTFAILFDGKYPRIATHTPHRCACCFKESRLD